MKIRSPMLLWWCVVGMLVFCGCHNGTESMAPVKGKVTYKGTPLTGGTIVFIPDTARGTHGSLAVAEIHSDGTFTLKTNDVVGAVPGHHRVTVACLQVPRGLSSTSAGPGLPAKYRDPQQSGLAGEVLANTANTINFDLD